MDMTIKPYEGVGPIRFGMSVDQVRRAVGKRAETFKKAAARFPDAHPVDAFDEVGMHVFYKRTGVCEAIMLFPPATSVFQNEPLLNRRVTDLLPWFTSLDEEVERDEVGLTSFEFGISITESPGGAIEAVLVFDEPGYYGGKADVPLDRK
jgi:hypothetical protein